MDIVEDVTVRDQEVRTPHPESAYPELRELLESRMSFDHVEEEKYYNDLENGVIRARIKTVEGMDNYTAEILQIYLTVKKESSTVEIKVKGKLETHYPEDFSWQNTVWYYAYRALYDEFVYGSVRAGFEDAVEDKIEELMDRTREVLVHG